LLSKADGSEAKMRVVVSGASGMIGSAVCDALLARGDEVVGLTRDPDRARETNPTVTWHRWDPANERPPEAALAGADAVVNLVGEEINQRLTDAAKRRIRESRVRATKNLVDGILAGESGPRALVSQSAIGVYGDRGEAMLDESAPIGDGFVPELVADWEREAETAAQGGVRVVVVRSGLVLDPDGGLLGQLLLPFRLGVGGPLAGGDQYMPWIHIDDEVALLLWAIDNGDVSGVINATAPNPVSNREFSKALGRALNRPSFMPAPRFAIAALRGEELAEQVVGSYRVIPRRALDLGFAFRFTEVEPALQDLLARPATG
jgi:uncharacterized protein (TIGR01777 family)